MERSGRESGEEGEINSEEEKNGDEEDRQSKGHESNDKVQACGDEEQDAQQVDVIPRGDMNQPIWMLG